MSVLNRESQFIVSFTAGEENENKEKGRCSDHKCNLVDYHSLPNFLKHNEFVVNYYRSEWPLKQTVLSIFSLHNETLNIWTHLIGFFVFLALAATMIIPSIDATTKLTTALTSSTKMLNHQLLVLTSFQTSMANSTQQVVARWPFYAYLAGAMFCTLMSSACHLLSCHSEHACYVMLRLDYAGISALIVTSFYPLVYYTFVCDPFTRNLYMGFITVFGVASVAASLVPVFERAELRMLRAGMFACMGLSGVVPIVHKMVEFGDRQEATVTAAYEMAMLGFYGVGAVVYTLRIPERWMPGRFDLVGHSHQLWHVLVFAGAYTHYLAGLVYLSWRDVERCF